MKDQVNKSEAQYKAITRRLTLDYLRLTGCESPSLADCRAAGNLILDAVTHIGTEALAAIAGGADQDDIFNKVNEALESAPILFLRAHLLGWRDDRVKIIHRYFDNGNTTRH
jgi:hypothetical protein